MVEFRIDAVIDPSRARRGSREVQDRLRAMETSADRFRRSILSAVGALGAGIVARRAIQTLATFEQSLATVRAVTGATAEEFQQLRDRAQELGITTRFTATQAGDALTNLARAGFSVQESLEAVGGTLLLAQSGGLGLAEATDIAASALRGFRLEASEAERVVDVLTLTANSANTTVGQLGEGLKFVAPIAAGLRQSLELTSAALGVLSDAGLKATLAGTGLRRVLSELEAPSSTSVKILRDLGVSAEEVRVSQVGLVAALERLRDAGIDTGTALEFFGQRGGPAFEVLVNNIPRLRELNSALQDSAGIAQRTADVIDDNLNGAILRAKSALEGLVLAVGDAGATSTLTQLFNGLASALRSAADNVEVTSNLLLVLGATSVARVVPSILGLGSALRFTSPLFGTAAAAAGVFAFRLGQLQANIEGIRRSFAELEKDSSFARIGQQIRAAQSELNRLAVIQERQGFLSESQQARVNRLTAAIAELRAEAKREGDAQREVAKAREQATASVENSLAVLDRRIRALQDLSREAETAAKAEQEVQRLLQQGVRVSPEQRGEIQRRIELVQRLEDQRRVLEQIRGPQEEAARTQAALNALLERGAISGEEFRTAMDRLRSELEEVQGADPLEDVLGSLREAVRLGEVRIRQGDFVARALALENELRAQGVQITREVQDEIASLLLRQQAVTQELEKQRQADRDQQRLQFLATRLDLTRQQAQAERDLGALVEQGLLTQERAAQVLAEVQLRALDSSLALEDGFARAFAKIANEAENLASVAEASVNVFADNAAGALAKFVETGKLDFRELATSILNDLAKIITRLLVVQSLSGLFGGGRGSIGGALGLFGGARQHGGPVQPGKAFLVGERGPELFVPPSAGRIEPSVTTPAPVVQVVNVQNPDEVPEVIASGKADEAIINVIARNPDKVRQVVG